MKKYNIQPITPEEFREELRRVFKKDYGVVLTEEALTRSVENIDAMLRALLN